MRVQCIKKQAADAKRRQLVVAQLEIEIVEQLKEKKPAKN